MNGASFSEEVYSKQLTILSRFFLLSVRFGSVSVVFLLVLSLFVCLPRLAINYLTPVWGQPLCW